MQKGIFRQSRYFVYIVVFAVIMNCCGIPAFAAGQNRMTAEDAGAGGLSFVEISDEEAERLLASSDGAPAGMAVYARNWSRYGSNYFDGDMTSDEKLFYAQMQLICNAYMESQEDAVYDSGQSRYVLTPAFYSGITFDEARGLIYTLMYQNPQYYFVDSTILYNRTEQFVCLTCYDAFADGGIRKQTTNRVFAKVDSWIAEIEREATPLEREKKAHDIVCANTEYRSSTYDQSMYGAVMEGKAVCAGYAKLFSALMNGSGINTLGIVGSNHAWNKCYIGGIWYNVDTTWDDTEGGSISYAYFNRSDAAFGSGHQPYKWYTGRLPGSNTDCAPKADERITYVSGVKLDKGSAVLNQMESVQLYAEVSPQNATDNAAVWTSSDENVATVSATGLVTARGHGNAVITVTTNNKSRMASCSIEVLPPPTDATVSAGGLYLAGHTRDTISLGMVAVPSKEAELEYRWLVSDTSVDAESWQVIQDWTRNNEWLNWRPQKSGDFVILGQVRVVGNESSQAQEAIGIPHHEQIKGKCQMPYTGEGGGYLIGIESYDNPEQSYTYELLVLDCTLLADGKDAWIWSTGRCGVPETSFWAVWQPQYGYYWTLFRVYDKEGNMIDQECYPFVNAY